MTNRTYLSIDLDYFAYDHSTVGLIVKKQVNAAIRCLKAMLRHVKKPIYLTLGHDLHCFDVARYGVNKIINIDQHSDCLDRISFRTQLCNPRPVPTLKRMAAMSCSQPCGPIHESTWIHFCPLYGDSPRVEHWYPERLSKVHGIRAVPGYSDFKSIVTLFGTETIYNKQPTVLSDLPGRIKEVASEIVAVGIAVSPSWCNFARYDDGWNDLFFRGLREMPIFRDWKPDDFYTEAEETKACPFQYGDFKVTFSKKRKFGVPESYKIHYGRNSFCVSCRDVWFHRPSVQNAIDSLRAAFYMGSSSPIDQ